MAVPWLRLLDAALGLTDLVRSTRGRSKDSQTMALAPSSMGRLETRLAGVVVGALKEAFDRDSQRLEIERQHAEAERLRLERAMRLEGLRQAGDREIARMRLMAVTAIVGWAGTLFLATPLLATVGGRIMLGAGWTLLLVALACAFAEQSRLARIMAAGDDRLSVESAVAPGMAGIAVPWLLTAGLIAVTIGVLLT